MEDAYLFGAHEVGETYAALWNDELDDLAQVPTHIVDVEGVVGLGTLA